MNDILAIVAFGAGLGFACYAIVELLLMLTLFCIRLYITCLFIAKFADVQLLNAPTTLTRCLIYGNATFLRWKQFRANGYSVEGIEWKRDALDATVPKQGWSPPMPAPPPVSLRQQERDEDLLR